MAHMNMRDTTEVFRISRISSDRLLIQKKSMVAQESKLGCEVVNFGWTAVDPPSFELIVPVIEQSLPIFRS